MVGQIRGGEEPGAGRVDGRREAAGGRNGAERAMGCVEWMGVNSDLPNDVTRSQRFKRLWSVDSPIMSSATSAG